MVLYVLDAAQHDDVRATVVVVGHDATWVEKEISERRAPDRRLTFVEQREQLGTGHAVTVALPSLDDAFGEVDGDVLILPGDAPLLRRSSVARLLDAHRERHAALTMLGANVEDPTGYGRMIHAKDGTLQRVVEESDATPEERRITEVNTSVMVVRQSLLGPALRHLDRRNAQEEYYLTDLVAVLHDLGHVTTSVMLEDATEGSNINDRRQLARAEALMRHRINDRWLTRGVTMWSPTTTYVDADVELAADVSLLPGTVLRGHCVIGRGAEIGPNAMLRDVEVGEGAVVGAVDATRVRIGAEARVGSFVVLAPGADVGLGEIVTPSSPQSH
jgi:bifunctional UDP-N-acetylglucosamine pyrophosphorylase/glucosamine-1-phosphate N-acetyltransferase